MSTHLNLQLNFSILFICTWLLLECLGQPDPLFKAWKEFENLHTAQTEEFERNFPTDARLFGSLTKCRNNHLKAAVQGNASIGSSHLQPSAISVYAEIGHQAMFCDPNEPSYLHGSVDPSDIASEMREKCVSTLNSKSSKPSLPRMLRMAGGQVEIVESEATQTNFLTQTKRIIPMIKRTEGFSNNRWKMILMVPGLYDITIGGDVQRLTDEVIQSVEVIAEELPDKTMVVIVRNSKFAFWKMIAKSSLFCDKMLSLWKINTKRTEEAWDLLETRIRANFKTGNFYVFVVNAFDESMPIITKSQYPDFSVMSSDCIHFSGRGLSLLHIYIWNWLVQPSKRQPWVPLVRRLYCPRPACPFFATEENIHSCPYRWQSADGRNRKKYVRGELTSGRGQIDSRDLWYFNHVMVIACIAFYFTIFLCLLCCRIRKRRYNG